MNLTWNSDSKRSEINEAEVNILLSKLQHSNSLHNDARGVFQNPIKYLR